MKVKKRARWKKAEEGKRRGSGVFVLFIHLQVSIVTA